MAIMGLYAIKPSKRPVFVASIDNIDAKVDIPDGKKNSFHATSSAVYQTSALRDSFQPNRALTVGVKITGKLGVSTKVPELEPWTVTGNAKPEGIPHYPNFTLRKYSDTLKRMNF